ncbi:Domain of unknown function DUF305 [Candidatus Planktophila versatilis]|uniref:DUF305 domain-containing protein n=1 Tax=Candidatus Planktophila versatilis TaxID=1884905 RepID=UPI003BEF1CD0
MFKKIVLLIAVISLPFFSQPATAGSHASSLKSLGANEIMFAQGMIPHHQQAIDMSTSALARSSNAKVKALASGIISDQKKEINQMKYWLAAKKAPLKMGHDMGHGMGHGMGMDGMLSESQVAELKKLRGPKFDTAFLKAMIEHHQGALTMLSMLSGSKNSEARALSKEIRAAQSGEISVMQKLLMEVSK